MLPGLAWLQQENPLGRKYTTITTVRTLGNQNIILRPVNQMAYPATYSSSMILGSHPLGPISLIAREREMYGLTCRGPKNRGVYLDKCPTTYRQLG